MRLECEHHLTWWYSVFPGLTIMWAVLALNLVGDALRDVLAVAER